MDNKIDILVVSQKDWCNRAYKMVHALKTTGLKVEGCSLQQHPFFSDNILPIVSPGEMEEMISQATLVWFAHGETTLLNKINLPENINAVVTYSGTSYRFYYKQHNQAFNFVQRSILLGHDHMFLGAKNPLYNSCRIIDTEQLKPAYHKRKIPVIGHFPSQTKKGTKEIGKILDQLLNEGYVFEKRVDTNKQPYNDNIKRMQDCDIYIEQLKPFDGNKHWGEISNQAYEAAALGNVVISNLTNPYYYKHTHGHSEILIANDEYLLKRTLQNLLSLKRLDLFRLQKQTRSWIEQKHSYHAIGQSLKDLILDLLYQQPAPHNLHPTTCNQQPTIGNQQPATSNQKPKICFIYDVKGWAYYNKSISIAKHLQDYYDISLIAMSEANSPNYDLNQYDAIITYWFMHYNRLAEKAKTPKLNENKLILGASGLASTTPEVVEKTKHLYTFANNPELYQRLKSLNRYYCPNGVDIAFFAGVKRSLPEKTCNIAAVGSERRFAYKGGHRIKEICERLTLLGYNVNNKSLFVNAKNTSKILSKQEMREFYKDIDIFVVSSIHEGTPNPLLEAMAMGIPVVANKTGFAPILIENNKTGFLVDDYDDIDGYVKNIQKLIDKKTVYKRISKNAIEKIKEYDWSIMARNYKKMIDDFLNIIPQANELLTVIIRAAGERTEQLCYNLITKQIAKENIFIIRKAPFSEALKETYKIGIQENRKWTASVDADVLINDNVFNNLLHEAENAAENIFTIFGKFQDKFIDVPRMGGVRLYRTKQLPQALQFVTADAIRPEASVINAMDKKGFSIKRTEVFIGTHDYEQYYKDIYRKCFIHAIKHPDFINIETLKSKANSDPDYIIALHGYNEGLKHKKAPIDVNYEPFQKAKDIMADIGIIEKSKLINKPKPIYFVGTASGKFLDEFLEINKDVFSENGYQTKRYPDSDSFRKAIEKKQVDVNDDPVIVNIYCEDNELKGNRIRKDFDAFNVDELVNSFNNPFLVHSTKLGLIIGSKKDTNELLSAKGISCPKLIKSNTYDKKVFQNEKHSSGKKTKVIAPGATLNNDKYNAEFIDTRYNYNGELYYCSIRAHCVGKEISSVYLRFRNTNDDDASVHNKDTPLLPELINSYYYDKIVPNYDKLKKMCQDIGEVFGLGFYTHDIALYNNEFYLLESGFKMHEDRWCERIYPIKNKIVVDADLNLIMKKLAYEFVRQLKVHQQSNVLINA